MPDGRDPDEWETRATSKLSPSWWLARIFPSKTRTKDKPALSVRLQSALLKPVDVEANPTPSQPETAEELQAAVKSLTDKERLIGLLAAPFAALIGILIGGALISHDPKLPSKLHVSVGLYQEAMAALVVLAVIMLATAYWRKRLYLAIVMALFGLTVFNLHYWGFGVPYLMAGSWMLVRAYRLNKSLRQVTGETSRYGSSTQSRGTTYPSSRPRPNRRYTPPTSR